MSKLAIRVDREHANAGDCRVFVTKPGEAEGQPFHIPGDVTAFTALRMLAPWLESTLSTLSSPVEEEEPVPETQPEVES